MKKLETFPGVLPVKILLFAALFAGVSAIRCNAALPDNGFAVQGPASAQDFQVLTGSDEIPPEKVVLISDRSLYITGERVHFSAVVLAGNDKNEGENSVVLYTEIITPEGKSIARGKFPLENHKSAGYLEIPAETVTGVYYLRAYTRIMRNEGPQTYPCLAIRIINPYKNEVLGGNDSVPAVSEPDNSPAGIKVSPAKDAYATGEEVSVITEFDNPDFNPLMVCVAVIPENTYNRIPVASSVDDDTIISSGMCRETRGLSISGVLKTSVNGQPVAGRRVNLSVIGDGKDFMAMNSDDEGRFYFTLPALTGWRDLYLGTTGTGAQQVKVFADNDFCSLPVNLPSPVFKLTDEERSIAVTMARNARVNIEFRDTAIKAEPKPGRPFYGTPDQVLRLSEFVELPTLEEYFNELAGLVKVRSNGGRKFFKVTGIQPEMAIFEPLVLIDHVAVDDFEELLSAPPTMIDRIEMFNQPYLKGDILYGGIVSIISKKGDFAGIDLPASGTFINYRFFNEPENEEFKLASDSPDARNTVFFGIQPQANDGKYMPLTFFTPATPGNYEIIMTFIDDNGDVNEYRKGIEVAIK